MSCQADDNWSPPSDPNLWNSPLGRRAFLKNTGVASAASLIVLHGLRSDVVASMSSTPTCGLKSVQIHFAWTSGSVRTTIGTSTNSPEEAKALAYNAARGLDLLKIPSLPGTSDMDSVSNCAKPKFQSAGFSSSTTTPPTENPTSSTSGGVTTYTFDLTLPPGNQCWLMLQYVANPIHPGPSECSP